MLELLGTLISAGLGYAGQREANNTNQEIAKENRDFQERMSSTAYQRAVGDMSAAGLNPMLAYQQGGASSPAGSTTTVGNAMGAAVSSAQQASGTFQAIEAAKQNRAMTDQIISTTEKIRSETLTNKMNTALAAARLKELEGSGDVNAAEAEVRDVAGKSAHRQYEANVKHNMWEQDVLTRRSQSEIAQIEAQLQGRSFSADAERRRAIAQQEVFAVPEAKGGADFYEKAGAAPRWLQTLLQVLKGANSARSLGR